MRNVELLGGMEVWAPQLPKQQYLNLQKVIRYLELTNEDPRVMSQVPGAVIRRCLDEHTHLYRAEVLFGRPKVAFLFGATHKYFVVGFYGTLQEAKKLDNIRSAQEVIAEFKKG